MVALIDYAVEMVPIDSVYPSPENDSLYGEIDPHDIDLINLANDIAENGVREPIQLSSDGYIVSGHRRYAASVVCGMESIPVVRLPMTRTDHSIRDWQKVLRGHNHQRVKTAQVRVKETLLDVDPDLAYQQLIVEREIRDADVPPSIVITGKKVRCGISDRKQEMLDAVLRVVSDLKPYWPITVRQIHYGLLNDPPMRNTSKGVQRKRYENNKNSYGDLTNVVTRARLIGAIPWEAIADETRPVSGTRYSKDAATFADVEIHHFLRGYRRDLMQSQADHVELIVEKMTVQNILQTVANKYTIPITTARGYCSTNPRQALAERFRRSGKDRLILLIASDFDPDGDEIAESFVRSIRDDFHVSGVVATKVLLRQDQISAWNLPPNGAEAKESSSKYKKFVKRYGSTEVFELEAVSPVKMQEAVTEAIEQTIDMAAFNAEIANERDDAALLQAMKTAATEAFRDLSGNE